MSESICVDTGPLILHLRARPGRPSPLTQLDDDVELLVSAISVAELWQGAHPSEQTATQALVDLCTVVPVDAVTAHTAGRLVASFRSRGLTLGLPAALVAATALAAKVPLWSTNAKGFLDIAGLEVLSI